MKRQSTIVLHTLWICFIIGLLGCGEEPPPVQTPKPVSKKITMQPTQQASVPQEAKTEVTPQPQVKEERTVGTASTTSADTGPSQLVQESLQLVSSYDPTGRFDPFEPLFKEETQAPAVSATKGRREKRVPQTPLEKVALSQLKLTAIIRAPSGNRALVEDATGKGYIVAKGTYVGLNSGRVTEINNDRIVIEEEIENVMGEIEIQNEELKLQKPAGEL